VAKQFQSVRGMYDVLPDDQAVVDVIIANFKQVAEAAGFGHIETPIVEEAGLFNRSVGEGTDIIDKEMYVFEDRSGNNLALRPEGTAGIARAYIEHGMNSLPQPVKLYSFGPMFRYDRPQAGRQRQLTQLGAELLGEAAPSADAQIIVLAARVLRSLNLVGIRLQINSIGDEACRPKYKKVLTEFLNTHRTKLCDTCQSRLDRNPLRVLDCKEEGCQAVMGEAPQTLNHLCQDCQSHFSGVLEYLDDLGVEYELNPLLVRGLDYYTRTVFEFYGQRAGAQASLGAGGRYDGLVQLLGAQATPAVGFAMGVERIAIELKECGIEVPIDSKLKVYVASLGEPARLVAFRLTEQLLDAGVGAAGAVDKNGIQNQLSRADRLGVRYAIIIGQKEVMDATAILRDMSTGAQEMIPLNKIVAEVKKRF
jgi:histidyl-tRNA synthetase